MLIPIRCFTCGKILADKWDYYQKRVIELKDEMDYKEESSLINFVNISKIEKTPEGLILDELGLNKMCCRRHMLTHVDLTN